MTPQQKQDWADRFREEFPCQLDDYSKSSIIDFFEQELARERREMIEEIEEQVMDLCYEQEIDQDRFKEIFDSLHHKYVKKTE